MRKVLQLRRRRRDLEKLDYHLSIQIDNGPNTTYQTTSIVVTVNYTCDGCQPITTPTLETTAVTKVTKPLTGATLIIVLASVSIFVVIFFRSLCYYVLPPTKDMFSQASTHSSSWDIYYEKGRTWTQLIN